MAQRQWNPNKKRRNPEGGHDAESAAQKRKLLQHQRQDLPVWAVQSQLLEKIRTCKTTVVVGETGSGKTTQIPQFLHKAGFGKRGMIACTQPRRVAAMTVARRVAEEMGCPLGKQVGYSVRFDDMTSSSTIIKYLTDGMLLREALLDPLLKKYSVVIVDEAHERTVHTDVLFGLLKGVQKRRGSDFRLVVMSATLDSEKFVEYFGCDHAAYIEGRQYPVQVHYTAQPEDNYLDGAMTAALQVHLEEGPGDVLVFLTGQEEIDSLEKLMRDKAAVLPPSACGLQLMVLPIYAALPPDAQMKVFDRAPEGYRKVILATNIAETSITISGVRYVIDTGLVKARGYNAKLGVDSLQVVPISQAQARQRSGRAGREAPGKAYRLFTEASFQSLAATTLPEIQRSNLSSVVLQMKAMGIDDIIHFDFMDPPPKAALIRSLELLLALGALDRQGQLTKPLGVNMARLPVDPMFARVLLAATQLGCGVEALEVVAMMSAENIFYNPRHKQDECLSVRKKFIHPSGDHLTLMTVYKMYQEVPKKDRTQWCADNFINIRSLRKSQDIYMQLEAHLRALGLPLVSCGDNATPISKALVMGLFPHATRQLADGSYQVIATGQQVHIHPSSVLSGKKVPCLVFNELVRTTRQYAREVTKIEMGWLPELAPTFFASKAGQSRLS